ncbi:hypothetical protein ACFLUS_04525 [Chloroflexota bacterium]
MSDDKIINDIASFHEEQYKDWLFRGITRIYSDDIAERAKAFDGLAYILFEYNSIPEGLARIYIDYVPKENRQKFHVAIGLTLRKLANVNIDIHAFEDLITLIAIIKADEALNAIVPVVGNGIILKKRPELLYQSISLLRSFGSSNEARETINNLINCTNFDNKYLFEAIKVLVEGNPENTAEIVHTYYKRLTKEFLKSQKERKKSFVSFCDAALRWTQFINEKGLSSWRDEFWNKVEFKVDDNWLLYYLFSDVDCSGDDGCTIPRGQGIPLDSFGVRHWSLRFIRDNSYLDYSDSFENEEVFNIIDIHSDDSEKEEIRRFLNSRFITEVKNSRRPRWLQSGRKKTHTKHL